MRSHAGVLRLALCFIALLIAMTIVVKRQTHAFEVLKALDKARTARAVAEAHAGQAELSQPGPDAVIFKLKIPAA